MENERTILTRNEATERAPDPSPLTALAPILRCPHCQGPLVLEDRALVCRIGHCFDLAREGYVNLSHSRQTGDSVEMLRARRRFLDAGHYQPLSDLINRLAAEHHQDPPCTVLDAGCGEGYYLGRLHRYLREYHAHRGESRRSEPLQPSRAAPTERGGPPPTTAGPVPACRPRPEVSTESIAPGAYSALGLDVAKAAARMAARRSRDTVFLVADLTDRLPLAAEAIDVLLNIFAPRHAEEFARVLRPNGLLLTVIPQPDHLAELRRRLPMLGIEGRKEDQVRATLGTSFVPVGVERLSYPLYLTGEAVGDLVGMTPSARHLSAAARADLAAPGAGPLTVTASFLVLSFRRRYT